MAKMYLTLIDPDDGHVLPTGFVVKNVTGQFSARAALLEAALESLSYKAVFTEKPRKEKPEEGYEEVAG